MSLLFTPRGKPNMRKYIYVTATEEDIGKDIIDFVKEQVDLKVLRE